jgi:hypothetical protein
MIDLNPSRIIAVFPLGNFEMESNNVVLSEEVQIRKMNEKERPDGKGRTKLIQYPFGIEMKTKEIEALENIPQFVLTALRLYKSGLVGFGSSCIIKEKPSSISDEQISSAIAHYIVDPMKIYGSPYILRNSELQSFREFFRRLLTCKHDVSIIIAFWKFNEAMQTFEKEDQFLDLIVVLETLYSRDERGEKKMKLATRISWLLGRSQDEIDWIHDKIMGWYKYRNEMLHSGYPSSESLDKINLVVDCVPLEEIVRRSFLALIALLQKFSKAELWKKLEAGTGDQVLAKALQKEISRFYKCSFPGQEIPVQDLVHE